MNKEDAKNKLKEGLDFTKDKLGKAKDVTIKSAKVVKNKTGEVANKVQEKVKTSITEEQMQEVLNSLYIKSVNGIPKVSLPIDDLVEDYISKNKTVEDAAKSLINVSTVKCGTSGFITSFGGFTTMIATLPANITSVMYVQLRMCCAIAKMAGYDITSDQVQTLVFVCLTGSAAADIIKQTGIKLGNKMAKSLIEKIPGKTLTAINKAVGFRMVTKFGEKGIFNLGKMVPVVGAVVGGGMDVASTRTIGYNAYKLFMKGDLPTKEEIEKDIPIDAEAKEIDINDIDTQTLNEAINKN